MPANIGIVDDSDYEDPAVQTLHHAAKASDAALEAAEELAWPLGGFVGLCVYFTWDIWLGAIAVAIAAYFFAGKVYIQDFPFGPFNLSISPPGC